MSNLRKTTIDVKKSVKEESVKVLNHMLAEFLTLALVTKQAHWNMRGRDFISVHEMLDPFNAQLLVYADQVAERIIQLGGTAYGTAPAIVKESSFTPYPTDITSVTDHLNALLERYSKLANDLREIIEADKADPATIDILTQANEDLDKYVWFIEAQLDYK